jgi:hypothetical protein
MNAACVWQRHESLYMYMYSRRVVQTARSKPCTSKEHSHFDSRFNGRTLVKKSRSEDKILVLHVYKFIHTFEPINQKRRLEYHR